jgi:hypothetical protein
MQLNVPNTCALRFVGAMNVPRIGTQLDPFFRDLTPGAARNKLAKTGHTLCEFMQCKETCTKLYLDRDVRLAPGELPTPERIASELLMSVNVEAMLQMLKTDETDTPRRAESQRPSRKQGRVPQALLLKELLNTSVHCIMNSHN